MRILEHGRLWDVVDGHNLTKNDWFVCAFGNNPLYMNNVDGYMVLYEFEPSTMSVIRILKADI